MKLKKITAVALASAMSHAEILEVVKPILAEQNIDLEITVFNDYVTPNTAVEDGSLDANYFQHITYMNGFNESDGTHLVSVVGVEVRRVGATSFVTEEVVKGGEFTYVFALFGHLCKTFAYHFAEQFFGFDERYLYVAVGVAVE